MTPIRTRTALSLILLLFIGSCARVGAPTGGPEDETPPVLISSTPEAGTTNFEGQTIQLSFDERIITRSIETDLIITPKPAGTYRARVNKNVLSLSFTEPFQENTTYNLSFGSTIQDITNNNPAEGINLSFSTGEYIDSLTIAGKVLNLYTQDPIENLLVSLYSESDSLDILTGPASYYSRTDSAGNYNFRNLPSGQFRVYAVRDKNNNSQADSESELYGFYPDTLSLSSSLTNIDFTIQSLNTERIRTVSARNFGIYYDISFNKSVSNFEIVEGEDLIYSIPEASKVRFYPMDRPTSDTTQLIFSVKDSLNSVFLDTVQVSFNESRLDPAAFSFEVSPSTNQLPPKDTISISFNKPVLQFNADSLYYQLDSTTTHQIDPTLISWDKLNTQASFPIDIVELLNRVSSPNIFLVFKTGAFISADNDTSIQQDKSISLLTTDDSAVIGGSVVSDHEQIIVQLLDSRTHDVVRTSNSKEFLFTYLSAGRYMIRVIKDINGNGKWDIGNLLNWESPEPAKFYFDDFYKTKFIEVRKNWEQTDVNVFF
ncbi:Ig-like domain-containing protein [Roseivirga sp. E12]|uniref:Ig-like domain-containing protein n=1 Tax=Roseivirga sp. E12 TaxID=2819237 RepID=UPI001ABD33D5|nr:Ig-like domain-containing protein [Roseivirga sp. E12]MBO3698758.1 Ig-like domain-containing protein [Roseivirga sp. E12]